MKNLIRVSSLLSILLLLASACQKNEGNVDIKPAVAAFIANSTTITVGGTVNFTDQSTNNPTSWLWSFGDGGISTLQNPSRCYTTLGNFTVTLTASNSMGSDVKTKTDYITVNSVITVTDADGNVYNTVSIGNQLWMRENLKTTKYRDGTSIINITDNTAWVTQTTGSYCWYNNDAATYKATYGAMYNYFAVVDSRNLCPTGWHIPTDTEWSTLTTYLGGESVAGGKMKATILWVSPNTGADNSSGFTGLPNGYRDYNNGNFGAVGAYTQWWSCTTDNASGVWVRWLQRDRADANRDQVGKVAGSAVRCVQD